jgi:signal transduction histidine kinase
LLVTGITGWTTREGVRDRRQQRFDALAEGTRTAIERRVASYAEALFGLRSLFAVDPDVSRADFHDYLAGSDVIRRFPGAVALSFCPMVPAAERAAFEARVRRDTSLNGVGYPTFAVHPPGTPGNLVVVDYLEPMEDYEPSFGFELTSDPVRRSAVEEARNSGELTATAPVTLVQGVRGFLLFLAVYDGRSLPVTPPARRRHFRGVVSAVFVTEKMLEEVLGAEPRLHFDIYDLGLTVDPPQPTLRSGALVYDGPRRLGTGSEDGPRRTLDLNVGSRRWRIVAVPGPAFTVASDQWLPWGVLASGIALTLLVSGLVVSFGRSRRLAVAMAEKMTADLAEREAELREANRLLIEANERLMEADRTRTAFLSVVSHELQTPLTSIVGFSNLLVERTPGEEAADYARRIARNAAVLSNVIGELVEFTRLERGAVVLATEAVSLADLVPQVVDQLETVLSGHRVELDLQPEVRVAADPEAVTRILANLLTNAAKFSPGGTPVRVVVATEGQWGKLTVEDDGPGIPEDERARVFEPFFRGDGAVGFPGTGVGLAVVGQLTERMGGATSVAEAAGGGARLTISLPRWTEPGRETRDL